MPGNSHEELLFLIMNDRVTIYSDDSDVITHISFFNRKRLEMCLEKGSVYEEIIESMHMRTPTVDELLEIESRMIHEVETYLRKRLLDSLD